jgi:replication-associated recombination protein RarA
MAQTTFDDLRLTPGGFDSYEAKSALQKSIRRCLEEDALYWAAELALWNTESLWTRLKVIASEDVGLASPVAVSVRLLYENWKESSKGGRDSEGRLFIAHAVLLLVRAPKSRIVDHATIMVFKGGFLKRPVPDYAHDKHTQNGKSKGRKARHFFEVGAKLENCKLLDPYEAKAREIIAKEIGEGNL